MVEGCNSSPHVFSRVLLSFRVLELITTLNLFYLTLALKVFPHFCMCHIFELAELHIITPYNFHPPPPLLHYLPYNLFAIGKTVGICKKNLQL